MAGIPLTCKNPGTNFARDDLAFGNVKEERTWFSPMDNLGFRVKRRGRSKTTKG
jgi:hypothetical protein